MNLDHLDLEEIKRTYAEDVPVDHWHLVPEVTLRVIQFLLRELEGEGEARRRVISYVDGYCSECIEKNKKLSTAPTCKARPTRCYFEPIRALLGLVLPATGDEPWPPVTGDADKIIIDALCEKLRGAEHKEFLVQTAAEGCACRRIVAGVGTGAGDLIETLPCPALEKFKGEDNG